VGKSTLFNRVVGKHLAITAMEAGTTRDRIEREVTVNRLKFILVDVGGIETTQGNDLENNIQAQVRYAVEDADVLIFVVDAKTEITADDIAVAEMLRKTNKPVVFIANKYESDSIADLMNFASLGLGVPIPSSAIHRSGLDEVFHAVTKQLRLAKKEKKAAEAEREEIDSLLKVDANVAIMGRPNVGKSSLVNKLLGKERVVVSEIPLTTRDTNDVLLMHEGNNFRLLDTAGMRRSGKIGKGIDRFATGRSLNALSEADVALLLLDGSEGLVAQDLHVAEKIIDAGVGMIVVVNKVDAWDDYEDAQEKWLTTLHQKFAFARWAPVVMISAKSGANINHVFPRVLEVMEERNKRIRTPELNRFIRKIVSENAPGQRDLGRSRPKIYYATQVKETPPKFVFFVNRPRAFHFSYKRYVENRLREQYGFGGTPIKLEFRERKSENPYIVNLPVFKPKFRAKPSLSKSRVLNSITKKGKAVTRKKK
jgi:GTPase